MKETKRAKRSASLPHVDLLSLIFDLIISKYWSSSERAGGRASVVLIADTIRRSVHVVDNRNGEEVGRSVGRYWVSDRHETPCLVGVRTEWCAFRRGPPAFLETDWHDVLSKRDRNTKDRSE